MEVKDKYDKLNVINQALDKDRKAIEAKGFEFEIPKNDKQKITDLENVIH
jgi:hypothetical protein